MHVEIPTLLRDRGIIEKLASEEKLSPQTKRWKLLDESLRGLCGLAVLRAQLHCRDLRSALVQRSRRPAAKAFMRGM